MSTITVALSQQLADQNPADGHVQGYIHLWETLTCGDDGSWLKIPAGFKNVMIQALGSFNSETLTIQGTIDESNAFTLLKATGDNATLTAAGGFTLLDVPHKIRPILSGATGGDVDVYIFISRL